TGPMQRKPNATRPKAAVSRVGFRVALIPSSTSGKARSWDGLARSALPRRGRSGSVILTDLPCGFSPDGDQQRPEDPCRQKDRPTALTRRFRKTQKSIAAARTKKIQRHLAPYKQRNKCPTKQPFRPR